MGRAVLLAATLLIAIALAMGPPRAQETPPGSNRLPYAPEIDPNLELLLRKLESRSNLYRKYARGFTCREVVRVNKYDVESASYKKDTRSVYDYIFEEIPGGRLREVREEIVEGKNGEKRKGTDFEPPIPPAYTWATVFGPENRGRFHFRPAGQVVKAYRLLTLIDFVGISPNPGGEDIAGWSGRIALESESLNLWSVDAEPSGQGPRLDAAIFRYQRAFAIAGVPLAERPHGWSLSVLFGTTRHGLSYPTEQQLSMTSLNSNGKMGVETKTILKYEDYRFFEVATEEEIQDAQDGE